MVFVTDNPKFTLYWKNTALGTIEPTGADFPWRSGCFFLEQLAPVFIDLFNFIVDENNFEQDPPFNAELLADENWLLKAADGEEIGICLPAVYLDEGEIWWRMR
jgi:hypothetical protein